jgi:hypothetical protein
MITLAKFLPTLLFSLFFAKFSAQTLSAQTRITFDEFPAGTVLTNQYGPKGVHFQGPVIYTTPQANSAPNALFSVSPVEEVFSFPGPVVVNFDTGQGLVRLRAGTTSTQPVTATLTAFDAAGRAVAHDGPRSLPALQIKTLMEVKTAQKVIRRVEILYANDGDEIIDDLEFDGGPPSDVPKEPPKITLTSPRPSQQTNNATVTVAGTVTGPGVATGAILKLHIPRPPGSSSTADYNSALTLQATANKNVHRFSQPLVFTGIGPQTITVDAENSGGFHGKASVVVDYMPAALRTRVQSEGGTGSLGNFTFGSVNNIGPCQYAIYANGAVALANTKTFVARGAVFRKWLSLQDPSKFPNLGCPGGEQRSVAFGGIAQDFVGGRIYSSTPGAFFVLPVFTAAIDVLGGEDGVGLPVADPTSDSRPVFATWLFQQFRRTGVPLLSTIEIRGDPPKLYVERQAGDGSLFQNILRANNPTIVQSFTCTQTNGPCAVQAPPDEPLRDDTAGFCHNKEFDWKQQAIALQGFDPDPPEWVPIRGNYVNTPIWGVLFDVHLANGDNPFTHRNHFEPCPDAPTFLELLNEKICPSDWDLKIRPLPGYRSLQPVGRDAVQIEFERVDFQAHLVGYGDPTPGEMVFASGRYVVDCGHGPKFKTEIHPPSVYTTVRSVTYNGRPATEADTWVNRFFVGGNAPADAVDFDIYPPPRPSPQATLGASTPGNQTAAVNVTYTPLNPFGPVRVHISAATQSKPEVTKYGEMKPRGDDTFFGFDGRLRVYWSCPGGAC